MRVMNVKKRERLGILWFMMFVAMFFLCSTGVHAAENEASSTVDTEIITSVGVSGNEKDTQTSTSEQSVSEQGQNENVEQPAIAGSQEEQNEVAEPSIEYQAHVQNIGWQEKKSDGQTAGTTGQSKRVEALKITIDKAGYTGDIEYRVHVQNIGWTKWIKNGAMAGTSGRSLRVEAIQIRLTGDIASEYSIYYRVHSQDYGWLGWAKDGEYAGTQGYSKRVEALQIRLVSQNSNNAPVQSKEAFHAPLVKYQVHVQSIGWQTKKQDGQLAGTTGKSKRVEALKIVINNPALAGKILYRTHVQGIGWTDWTSDGTMSGTSGQSKRVEAIQVKLSGDISEDYNIRYRTHCQNFGWLGWAENGDPSGSQGYSRRVEALQIEIVEKGKPLPNNNGNAFYKYDPTVFGNRIVAAAREQIGVLQSCTQLVANTIYKVTGKYFLGNPMDYFKMGTTVSTPIPGDLIIYNNHIAVFSGTDENGRRMAVHGGWFGANMSGVTIETFADITSGYIVGYVRIKE